jgi:hypothetical protein
MANPLLKRLDKLAPEHKARLNKPIAFEWLERPEDASDADYKAMREARLGEMVEAGQIRPDQKPRVKFVRWMTEPELENFSGTILMRPSEAEEPQVTRAAGPAAEPAPAPELEQGPGLESFRKPLKSKRSAPTSRRAGSPTTIRAGSTTGRSAGCTPARVGNDPPAALT